MVPRTQIIKQKSMLTYEAKPEPTHGIYFHTLVLEDELGEEYIFRSTYSYPHDESGKAQFALDNVQSADFTERIDLRQQ